MNSALKMMKCVLKTINLLSGGAIKHTWDSYKAHAWGQDNLNPVSGRGSSGGFGHAVTMVDSLDTLWIAGTSTHTVSVHTTI